jgi:single-strand DNA-binding protein
MSFNKIIIVGNLGRDPELRYTPQGTPVCHFSVATNERRRDNAGEFQDRTTWFRVTAWGRIAEAVNQYLKKGSRAYIEGRLSVSEYTGRDGTLRTSLEVNASDIQFLDRRVSEVEEPTETETSPSSTSTTQVAGGSGTDDDVPF